MVSRTPPISPIQFSTLKALDPLDQEPEHQEGADGHADEAEVPTPHKPSQGRCVRQVSVRSPRWARESVIPALVNAPGRARDTGACAPHAASQRSLTEPMRRHAADGTDTDVSFPAPGKDDLNEIRRLGERSC